MTVSSTSDATSPEPTPLLEERPGRPRALLWWSVGLLAAVGLVGALIAGSPESSFVQPLDDWWRAMIGVSATAPIANGAAAQFFDNVGQEIPLISMALVIALVSALLGRWRTSLFTLTVLVVAYLAQDVLKALIDRPRPEADAAAGLFGPFHALDDAAYPSGHTSGITTLVLLILVLLPAVPPLVRWIWGVVSALLILGMMWERTLVNAHWLSDTIAGAMLGVATVTLVSWLFWPWLQADAARPIPLLTKRSRS